MKGKPKFGAICIMVQKLSLVVLVAFCVTVSASEKESEKTLGLIKSKIRQLPLDAILVHTRQEPEAFSRNIEFKYYKDNEHTHSSNGYTTDNIGDVGCDASDKFAFILHGWRQSCHTAWVSKLREKLTQYRGGCIVCIDYSRYANESYIRLMRNYKPIRNVILDKIKDLENQGFNPDTDGYMFGFSFGGQLASGVGRNFGTPQFKNIDTCDMAGPGFDSAGIIDHRLAAHNVQCLHTTRDKGTRLYNCHQNFRLGNCGFSQPASKDPPYGSHGLCVHMYISAFDHPFYVIPKPATCPAIRPATEWPKNFKMGYTETRMEQVRGELFVPTSRTYPYNVALNYYTDDSDESIEDIAIYVRGKNAGNNTIEAETEAKAEPITPTAVRLRPFLKKVLQARSFIRRRPLQHYG